MGPAEALMREIGAELRQARRGRGQEIEDVAEILRIQPAYLRGLEQGDLSVIPGRTYALGFLRSYAQHLGYDGEDLIAQIRSSGLAGGAALQGRAPLTESRLPKVPILVLSLAALAGAYAGWAYVDGGRAPAELVEEVPDDLLGEARSLFEAGLQATPPVPLRDPAPDAAPPVGAPATPSAPIEAQPSAPAVPPSTSPRAQPQAAVAPSAEPGETARAEQASATAPAPETALASEAIPSGQVAMPAMAPETGRAGEVTPAEEMPLPAMAPEIDLASEVMPAGQGQVLAMAAPETVSDAALASPAASRPALAARAPVAEIAARGGSRTYGTESAEGRVVLRARGNAWVHVSSTNNDYLWVQTLKPGDRFVVPARPDLVLWTGNAGGVEVLVDGALLPPLGPDAVVVRDVPLQPRALLRRLLPLPTESGGVSDLASAAKLPMMPPSSR